MTFCLRLKNTGQPRPFAEIHSFKKKARSIRQRHVPRISSNDGESRKKWNRADPELTRLWEEIPTDSEDKMSEKEQAQENMESFLHTLFHHFSKNEKNAFLSKKRLQELLDLLPPELVRKFARDGLLDRIPTAGFKPEAINNLELWTEEEFEVFSQDHHEVTTMDEEEESRRELLLLSAVRKLESFLRSYPEDPGEVFNMMVAAKCSKEVCVAVEADKSPLDSTLFQVDGNDIGLEEDDFEHMVDVDGIEACLKALEEGEDAPPPDPNKYKIIEADPPEVLKKRIQLMHDYYRDPKRKREDRKLSKAEYNEIKRRWDEFMPDKEPLLFKDIDHIRLAPKFPAWMEKHFRSMQHIAYILRAAHINAQITEPGRRLAKYDRISPAVTYSDPAIQLNGLDAYSAHMQRLQDLGLTTEPNMIFGDAMPPDERFDDPEIENPWNHSIIVDYHLNVPIPDWYHAILDEHESSLSEEDLRQKRDEYLDDERYLLTEGMDQVIKKKASEQKKKPPRPTRRKEKKKDSHPSEVASQETKQYLNDLGVGIKDGDPLLYEPVYVDGSELHKKKEFQSSGKIEGDFWYDQPVCEAWKDGYVFTINATVIYKIDIVAGQVCDIRMRWGALVGSILKGEDAERIYCDVSGVEYSKRRYKHDFLSEWNDYEYKPIRKNPIDWFREDVLGMRSE